MSSLLVIPISSPPLFSPPGMKPTTCPATISSLSQPTDPSRHLQFQWLTWFLDTWGARQAARSAGARVCCCTKWKWHSSCLQLSVVLCCNFIPFYFAFDCITLQLSIFSYSDNYGAVYHVAVVCSLELQLSVVLPNFAVACNYFMLQLSVSHVAVLPANNVAVVCFLTLLSLLSRVAVV